MQRDNISVDSAREYAPLLWVLGYFSGVCVSLAAVCLIHDGKVMLFIFLIAGIILSLIFFYQFSQLLKHITNAKSGTGEGA